MHRIWKPDQWQNQLAYINRIEWTRCVSSCAIGELQGWSTCMDSVPKHMEELLDALDAKPYPWPRFHKMLVWRIQHDDEPEGKLGLDNNWLPDSTVLENALKEKGWMVIMGGHAPHGEYNIGVAFKIPARYTIPKKDNENGLASKKHKMGPK